VIIATKFGRVYNRERHEIGPDDTRPESMRKSLEGSLRRLKTDYIDLYQLHVGDCPADRAIALREALEKVVKAGKIRAYCWSTDRVENAKIFEEGPHCTAIQQHLNVLDGNEELLAFCEAHNLASINRGPLAMGLLSGKYTNGSMLPSDDVRGAGHQWMRLFPDGNPNSGELDKLSAIRDILTSKGRIMAQGALAWIWGRSENTIPIPGFKGIRQAEENARAMEFGPLLPEQLAEIKQILQTTVN
jgi:aryl-alcohol dehydrogenase-like predicted oxidoreductase